MNDPIILNWKQQNLFIQRNLWIVILKCFTIFFQNTSGLPAVKDLPSRSHFLTDTVLWISKIYILEVLCCTVKSSYILLRLLKNKPQKWTTSSTEKRNHKFSPLHSSSLIPSPFFSGHMNEVKTGSQEKVYNIQQQNSREKTTSPSNASSSQEGRHKKHIQLLNGQKTNASRESSREGNTCCSAIEEFLAFLLVYFLYPLIIVHIKMDKNDFGFLQQIIFPSTYQELFSLLATLFHKTV